MKGWTVGSTTSGGAGFILETHASSSATGNHGVFCNSLTVQPTGRAAMGNLTDAADPGRDSYGYQPRFWLEVVGDNGFWAHSGSSSYAALGIQAQPLITTPEPDAEENNGTSRYWTDKNSTRWKYAVIATNDTVATSLAGAITNLGVVWFFLQTNGTPAIAAPSGSLCTTTNGQLFVNSNSVWLLK
jgi:hypothetical protein